MGLEQHYVCVKYLYFQSQFNVCFFVNKFLVLCAASFIGHSYFLMQEFDWSFDILNKKEWNQLNSSPFSFFMGIFWNLFFFLSLASWTLRPLRLVRKISGTLVEDAREMPTHQSWTESKWCIATCCNTFTPHGNYLFENTLWPFLLLSFLLFAFAHVQPQTHSPHMLTCDELKSPAEREKKTHSLYSSNQFAAELVQRSL